MTAQISDGIFYKNKRYRIPLVRNPIGFYPEEYGLSPVWACTACYRGYWCEYEILNNELFLKNLYVHIIEEKYPKINGVKAKKGKNIFDYMGHRAYEGLNIRMPYDGKLIIADDFLKEYYVHGGIQSAWKYKELKELVFENGKIVDVIDHSQIAEEIRQEADKEIKENSFYYTLSDAIIEKFISEYGEKCWWINGTALKKDVVIFPKRHGYDKFSLLINEEKFKVYKIKYSLNKDEELWRLEIYVSHMELERLEKIKDLGKNGERRHNVICVSDISETDIEKIVEKIKTTGNVDYKYITSHFSA